jgi:hypothetical protein
MAKDEYDLKTVDLEVVISEVADKTLINRQRMELVGLLDSATDGWIEFMDKVGQYLGPIVRAAGKPSKAELAKTMVGALGFKSWREMIEADLLVGGLGWKFSTYQQWRKAYAVVNDIEGMREQKLTPAEIIRKVKFIKDAEIDMPEDADGFNQLFATLQEDAKATAINTVKAELERTGEVLKAKSDECSGLIKKLSEADFKLHNEINLVNATKERLTKLDEFAIKIQSDSSAANEAHVAALKLINQDHAALVQGLNDKVLTLTQTATELMATIATRDNTITAESNLKEKFALEHKDTADELKLTKANVGELAKERDARQTYIDTPLFKRWINKIKKPKKPTMRRKNK